MMSRDLHRHQGSAGRQELNQLRARGHKSLQIFLVKIRALVLAIERQLHLGLFELFNERLTHFDQECTAQELTNMVK